MHASLRYLRCFIASLALYFAIGTALPAKAYADVVDLVDGFSAIEYKCLDDTSEPIASDLSSNGSVLLLKTTVGQSSSESTGNETGYVASSQGGAISISGTVNQSNGATSLTGMYTDTSHNVSVDTASLSTGTSQYNELFMTEAMALSGKPERPYMQIIIRLERNALNAGDRFKLIVPANFEWMYSTNNGTSYRSIRFISSYLAVYSASSGGAGNASLVTKDSTGYYTVPFNTQLIYVIIRPTATSITAERVNATSTKFRFYNPFKLMYYIANEDIENLSTQTIVNTQNVTNKIQQQTQQQTSELKDTSGSDSVISGTDGVSQQIQSKLGFIAETATITSNLYDAILYEGNGYVPFPEVAWQGQTIIAAQNVPILGYMPSIEDDIKTFNTIVLFFAWLHGMHSLYARIFLGQVEVISEDD